MHSNFLKVVDAIVFAGLGWLGVKFYVENPNIFDVVNIAALLYVLVRQRDVNTVSLVLLVLLLRLIDSVVFFDLSGLNNYVLHFVLLSFNVVSIVLIWFRPLLVSRYGPVAIRRHKDLAVTHQDIFIGFVFTLQAIWQLLAFVEHVTRHFDDIGLASILDATWWYQNSRLIYNSYPIVQFILAVLGIGVLYFMTFDASKKPRQPKA